MVDTVSGAKHDSEGRPVVLDWESHPKENPVVLQRNTMYGNKEYLRHLYWCKGCDTVHAIRVRLVGEPHPNDGGGSWEWDGDLLAPTYSPSQASEGQSYCHTYIRGGVVEFLQDSKHHLRGVFTQLPPLPTWLIEE